MAAGGSPAALIDELCSACPPARADALRRAHALVREAMPEGIEEGVSGRMVAWSIPLSIYPTTYNRQPLMVAALAATKGHNALHLPLLYMSPAHDAAFRAAYAASGTRLDMGRGCVRFRGVDGLDEAAIRAAIAPVGIADFLSIYEAARAGSA